MNREMIREVLEKVKTGALNVDEAVEHLRSLPFEEMGFATIDHHRPIP